MQSKFFWLLAGVLFFTACSKKDSSSTHGFESRPEVKADGNIGNSFKVEAAREDAPLGVDKASVSITVSALEKEFLLQSAMIPQPKLAMGYGLKSRVVAFRVKNDRLFLMEATQGHSISSDLPQNLILAEFPVIKADADRITFDFNKGMSSLFVMGDWYSQGFGGSGYDAKSLFTSLKVNISYIESAELGASNQLVIRQIAQLAVPLEGGSINNRQVEVKYYLMPYSPDPTYKISPAVANYNWMGFFEVSPQLTSSGVYVVHSSRFHPAKPIVYSISANTPAEFRQAVKDGILYWNKVFGREVVQVVDAPAGATAPNFQHNIIQWVPNDAAGYAYADAQMDPRTGQILHAQVYLTSTFAFGGKSSARSLLRRLKENPRAMERPHDFDINLAGFATQGTCSFHMNENMVEGLEELISRSDDAVVAKAAQDSIREVTAHEVGHTLGMRHDFAGSLATNFALADRDDLMKSYIKNMQAPKGVIATNSVMDYTNYIESLFIGDQMARNEAAYEHDVKAVAMLYDGKTFKDADLPLFCTDDLSDDAVADCRTFDTGASIVEHTVWDVDSALRNIPYGLLERYIGAKTPVANIIPKPIEKVSPGDPAATAASLLSERGELIKQLTTAGRLLKIERQFPFIGPINIEIANQERLNYVAGQFQRFGGIAAVFSEMTDGFGAKALAEFSVALQEHQQGIGGSEQVYSFTQDEMNIITKYVSAYFPKLEEELIKADLKILAAPGVKGAPQFVDDPMMDEMTKVFEARIRHYVFATTSEKIVADVELPNKTIGQGQPATKVVSVKLPKFAYSQEIRLLAAGLLRPGRSEAPEWAMAERAAVTADFEAMLEQVMTTPIEKVKPETMPKAVSRWVLENQDVLDAM